MDNHSTSMPEPSQLFTVRVWVESGENGIKQIRIQVKHVMSGATRTYREWSQVVDFLTANLQASESVTKGKPHRKSLSSAKE